MNLRNVICFEKLGNVVYKGERFDSIYLRNEVDRIKKILCLVKRHAQVVGVVLPRSEQLLVTMLAMLESDIPFLLLDINLPQKRLEYMINNAGVDAIITVSSYGTDIVGKYQCYYIDIPYVVENIVEYPCFERTELAYLIYTSGTTGKPKGVQITRRGLNNFIIGVSKAIDFSESKVMLCVTSITFDIFLLESVFALINGFTVVLADEQECSNPAALIRLILEHHINVVQMTPSRMQWLLYYAKNFDFLHNLKIIMLGGEVFPQALLEDLQEHTTAKIYNMYGPTETTIWSTISDLTMESIVNIGVPIRNTRVYILDEKLNEVDNGIVGEICIAGDGLAIGYAHNAEQTKEKFVFLDDKRERVYRTGDLGKKEDGKLFCYGRNDNQVKFHGYRIELDEIDYWLSKIKDVQSAVTCVVSIEMRSAIIVFYISKKPIKDEVFLTTLTENLPDYMIPSKYVHIACFDYTESGKIDRKRMIEKYLQDTALEKGADEEEDGLWNQIGTIIEKVIGRRLEEDEREGTKPLEIDSISLVRIVVEIEMKYGFEFDMDFFAHNTHVTVNELVCYTDVCISK